MLRNNGVHGGQPQTIAMTGTLRGEVQFEDMRSCFGIHAASGVGYCELDAWCAAGSRVSGIREPIHGVPGLDGHSPSLRHRVPGIEDEVENNLPELRRIHFHVTEIISEHRDELNFFAEHPCHKVPAAGNGLVPRQHASFDQVRSRFPE